MPDQAAGLRSLFARRRPSLIVVAGSDPCKAAVATHFAREAAAGKRVTVLVDGTAGQVAAVCEIGCRYELANVLAGDLRLTDVLKPLTPNLLLLPAARAIARADLFSADEQARLAAAFAEGIPAALSACGAGDAQVDLIVVHAATAQANRAVEAFGRDARVVIVASDRPSSLQGAYAELKALLQLGLENFEVVHPSFPNDDDDEAGSGPSVSFTNLAAAARRFLEIELVDSGAVRLTDPSCRAQSATPNDAAPSDAPSDSVSVQTLPINTSPTEVQHAAVA